MEKTCLKCSATLDADAVFCPSCRTPVTQTIECPNCQKPNKPDARYCKYCASSLSVEPASFVEPVASPAQPAFKDDPRSLISPSGAVFVLICFLLPWLELSGCNDKRLIVTGLDLGQFHWAYWSPPILAVTILTVFFLCKSKRVLFRARPFIIGASVIAFSLAVFFASTIKGVGKLRSGFVGTVIGFVLAFLGCFFMRRPSRGKSNSEAPA